MVDPARTEPVHVALSQFPPTDHGDLLLGGMPLTRLAERVGSTPFYAHSRGLMGQRVAELRAALPAAVHVHYAMKANPMPAVVGFMAGLVNGIDVASAGELKVALDAGTPPQDIGFAGPGKRDVELRQALAAGVLVKVESLRELRVLAALQQQLGLPARVALRVNPDFELKGAGMKMGGGPKPFGIDVDEVGGALAFIRDAELGFEGFHLYAGSQNLSAERICHAQRQSYELALRLAEHAPAPLKVLNLGGGFGIPYFAGEAPLALAPIGANLDELCQRARAQWPQVAVVIELGRYLVGEAGVYVTRIVDRKRSCGQVFLVCDGGLNHHLSASGNLGQVIRKNYPVTLVTRSGSSAADGPREVASLVGPLCTPLDLLADRMSLPVAEVGDLAVIFQSGAYGATASPQAFLGHPGVTEVLV